jgi:hypothetical protein
MAVLTNTKTWNKIYRSVVGGTDSIKTTLRTLKNDLITAGFSHVESCDGVSTSTSVDLWDSDSDLVWAIEGSSHSWIVLSNETMESGLKICINLNNASQYNLSLYLAYSSFSGGTTTNRPIATEEIEVIANENWGVNQNTSLSKQYNLFYSSDGKIVRVHLAYSGTSAYGYWNFERIYNSPTWVTKPVIAHVINAVTPTIRSNTADYINGFGCLNYNGRKVLIAYGGIYMVLTNALDHASLNAGDYNGDWPCTEIFVISLDPARMGILGSLSDLWYGIDNLSDFDTFPNDSSKTQVVIGDLIQGSDGSVVSW